MLICVAGEAEHLQVLQLLCESVIRRGIEDKTGAFSSCMFDGVMKWLLFNLVLTNVFMARFQLLMISPVASLLRIAPNMACL